MQVHIITPNGESLTVPASSIIVTVENQVPVFAAGVFSRSGGINETHYEAAVPGRETFLHQLLRKLGFDKVTHFDFLRIGR